MRPYTTFLTGIKSAYDKAIIRALNRASKSAASKVNKQIRDTYNIKASDINKYIKIIPATSKRPYVMLYFRDRNIGLIKFKAKQKEPGVEASVKRSDKHIYKSSFIATMPSGHTGVFVRFGPKVPAKRGYHARFNKKRQKIKELWGVNTMRIFGAAQSQELLEDQFRERFNIEFERDLKYFLSRVKL